MVEKRIFNDFINAALYKAIEPLMSSMEWFVVVHVLTISLNGQNWKVCGPIVLTVHRQETARQHDTSWPNVNEVDNKWIEADNVSMFLLFLEHPQGGFTCCTWQCESLVHDLTVCCPMSEGWGSDHIARVGITLQGLLTLMFCPSSMKLLIMSNNPL